MNVRRWLVIIPAMLCLYLSVSTAMARPHQAIDSIDALDEQISITLALLADGDIPQAQLLARQMAWRFPEFALGQLIHAELESVSAFQDVTISEHLPMARNVSELLLEAQRRLATTRLDDAMDAAAEPGEQQWPGNVVQLGSHLSQLLVADLQTSVLYHYKTINQRPFLVRQHYIGSGEAGFGKRVEGDLKTPLGVYTITGFRSDASLPDLYGAGALTLDYPNTLDRHLGRTGYGIWLHGVPPDQLSRTPYSSEGCVTMSNAHLRRLANELDASSTRVILTNNATPLDSDTRSALQVTFRSLFTSYQDAWMNGDETQLMNLYSNPDQLQDLLASGNNGLMRVNNVDSSSAKAGPDGVNQILAHSHYQQAFSAISEDQLSIFSHPDIPDRGPALTSGFIITITFGAASEYQITTYWAQSADGQWRIVTENTEGTGL